MSMRSFGTMALPFFGTMKYNDVRDDVHRLNASFFVFAFAVGETMRLCYVIALIDSTTT